MYKFRRYNLENLNTENVIDMSYMFNKCNIKNIKFPNSFNTKNVKDMSYMFNFCQYLEEIHFNSSFITNNVLNMRGMFGRCYNLKKLDLSHFNTSKVGNMLCLFDECNNLEEIIINPSTFITKNVKDMGLMFNNCYKIKKKLIYHLLIQ